MFPGRFLACALSEYSSSRPPLFLAGCVTIWKLNKPDESRVRAATNVHLSPDPPQGGSLKRCGMNHSDSYATVKEMLRRAVSHRRGASKRRISGIALVSNSFCLALPDSNISVGSTPITQNNMLT